MQKAGTTSGRVVFSSQVTSSMRLRVSAVSGLSIVSTYSSVAFANASACLGGLRGGPPTFSG